MTSEDEHQRASPRCQAAWRPSPTMKSLEKCLFLLDYLEERDQGSKETREETGQKKPSPRRRWPLLRVEWVPSFMRGSVTPQQFKSVRLATVDDPMHIIYLGVGNDESSLDSRVSPTHMYSSRTARRTCQITDARRGDGVAAADRLWLQVAGCQGQRGSGSCRLPSCSSPR